jgi:uncharacterized protein (TIGR04255 family)
MDKLKFPPLVRSNILIYFDNNLKIFENKSTFYEQIKINFPKIIFPENKYLKYPMGDVRFLTLDFNKVIEINTNLFSFSDYNYQDFNAFRQNIKGNFEKFSKIYGINEFNSFNLSYENIILLDKNIGEKFDDYFTMKFDFKGAKEKNLLATFGSFAFKVTEGLLSIDISPQYSDKRITEKYKFVISLISTFTASINLEKLWSSINRAHELVDDIFEKSLTEKYLRSKR